jgi:hypothetical protein
VNLEVLAIENDLDAGILDVRLRMGRQESIAQKICFEIKAALGSAA